VSRYALGRVLALFPVLLVTSMIVFVVGYIAPGDPVQIMMGDYKDPQAEANLRREMELDLPPWERYGRFLGRALQLDFGTSYVNRGRSVGVMIRDAFPVSASIAVITTTVAVIGGVTLGVISAVRRGTWVDRLARFTVLVGVSVPIFVLAAVFILTLALGLGLLPVAGWGRPANYVLPCLALALRPMAFITRITRGSMIQVLTQDYVRTARAKGLAEQTVVLGHALRNAAVSISTVVGIAFGTALTGAFVVESIFNIPGMGRTAIVAVLQRDYPVMQATVLTMTGCFMLVNLAVDLLYGYLNPRVRY
jgi:ABC-type dipeptide/oligopeptide/nickel transport system permease component